MIENLKRLEKRLGYTFHNENLLREALTHRSFVAEHNSIVRDNQRLEFLGDAVVQIVVTSRLFTEFVDREEGDMTKLRAALTREESLADFARDLGLGDFLRLGNGEERNNGRDRNSTLCDAFESVVGAMYLDSERKLESVCDLMYELVGSLDGQLMNDMNPKGELQEWAQRVCHEKPIYHTINAVGPDHEKVFTVSVSILGEEYGQGTAKRLRAAEQEAARRALEVIRQEESGKESNEGE